MNLLWISHNVPYPPIGGVLQRNYNLIKQCSEKWSVYLLALNQKALIPDEKQLYDSKKELESICDEVEVFDIPSDESKLLWCLLVVYNLFGRKPYSSRRYFSSQMFCRIKEIIQAEKIDVVHFDTIGLAPYKKAVHGIPAALNHHNIESHMMRRRSQNERNLFKKFYFYLESLKLSNYEKKMCPKFNLNITVSDLDKDRLSSMVPNIPIDVIANGVDLDYFKPQRSDSTEKSIIFVGGMKWYPNRDAMLYFFHQIWPLLRKRMPDIHFNLLGKNPPVEIINMSKSDSNIHIFGFVQDMRPIAERSTLFVCPMRDGGGTRLKILDALAMGKAIVSTSMAIEGISLTDGKDVILADSPSDFVDKIVALMADQNLREEIEKKARRFAERYYDWDRIGAKLSGIYEHMQRHRSV